VIGDLKIHMVEGIIMHGLVVYGVNGTAFAIAANKTAHGESDSAVLLAILQWITPGHRHVVYNPVVLVI